MVKYIQNPTYVDAVQVGPDNIQDIRRIAYVASITVVVGGETSMLIQTTPGETRAYQGDWVVRDYAYNVHVYTDVEFKDRFTEV